MISCTVIIVQYNPVKEKLVRTLKSAIMQRNVHMQIIIADDGSAIDYFADSKNIFQEYEFNNYTFVKNLKNNGTVINIINALEKVEYDYISLISPGDYYYDEKTIAETCINFKNKNIGFVFGRVLPYRYENNKIIMINKQFPLYIYPYHKYMKTHDLGKIKKYLVLYNDTMLGAALYWKRELLEKYLRVIEGKVLYAEDLITKLAVLDGVEFYYSDRYVTWYEIGTGISTSKNKKTKKKMEEDVGRFYDIMYQQHPDKKIMKRCKLLGSIIKIGGIKSQLLRIILFPDRFLYILFHSFLVKDNIILRTNKFLVDLYKYYSYFAT